LHLPPKEARSSTSAKPLVLSLLARRTSKLERVLHDAAEFLAEEDEAFFWRRGRREDLATTGGDNVAMVLSKGGFV
jgi:hypothetical protein